MPKYNVRIYSLYVDSFEVEALTPADAEERAWDALTGDNVLPVKPITRHSFAEYSDICISEILPDGTWIDLSEER